MASLPLSCQIEGKGRAQFSTRISLKQPFPVSKAVIKVKDKVVDVAFVDEQIDMQLDGKSYTGLHIFLFSEVKPDK